jgi:hypothetical protein
LAENVPENMSGRMPEDMSDRMSDIMSDDIFDKISENLSNKIIYRGLIHDIYVLCMICVFPRRNFSFRIRVSNFKDNME